MKDVRTVVVTGASTGIGEGCARYLAARGFHVFAGVRREADADRLGRETLNNLVPLFIDVPRATRLPAPRKR